MNATKELNKFHKNQNLTPNFSHLIQRNFCLLTKGISPKRNCFMSLYDENHWINQLKPTIDYSVLMRLYSQ